MSTRIEQESIRLSQSTGIDFSQYYNQDLIHNISQIIKFYRRVTATMIGSFILFFIPIACFSIYFVLQGFNPILVTAFSVFGTLFSAAAGTALGVIRLSRRAERFRRSSGRKRPVARGVRPMGRLRRRGRLHGLRFQPLWNHVGL